jgi:hypothetical protein
MLTAANAFKEYGDQDVRLSGAPALHILINSWPRLALALTPDRFFR